MNKNEAQVALQFLDRVEVKGHQERAAMNAVCIKLEEVLNAPDAPAPSKPELVD